MAAKKAARLAKKAPVTLPSTPKRTPPVKLSLAEKPSSKPVAPLPREGFVRLPQILTVIPVSKSHWWQGCKDGIYPKPVKLGPKLTAWRVEDIRTLIAGDGIASNDSMLRGVK